MDVKELLRDAAEDVRPDPEIPGPVAGRARRRRLRNGALAAMTVVALLVGAGFGVLGAVGLIDRDSSKWVPGGDTEPTGTVTEQQVRAFVLDFLEARAIQDDRAHDALSDMAADQYHRGEGGLHLFGPIATSEVTQIFPSEQDANLFEAHVVLYERPTEAVATEVREVLLVGPDPKHLSASGLIVLSAGIEGGPTGEQAQAIEAVNAFMEARLRGPHSGGAPVVERYLSPEGKARYDTTDSFGSDLYLYGHPWDDPDFEWTAFAITDVQRGGKENTFAIAVNIERANPRGGGEPPASFNELLVVGPGEDLQGHQQDFVVLSAEWVDV